MTRYLTVKSEDRPRLDVYLAKEMPDVTRSHIQKLIREGCVTVNDKQVKPNDRLSVGDAITLTLPEAVPLDVEPENIPLDILYEDEDLLVVNKPKQMVVHPAPGHMHSTLVNALLYYCGADLSGINGVLRPGIVHRIDRDTTGSLLVCKNDQAHQSLAKQLKEHSIHRVYEAIVQGNLPEDTGVIDAPIGRSHVDRKKMAVDVTPARRAVTHYQVLQRLDRYTYIQLTLETGRTHQIRVHMASIGHPVLGDPLYGPKHCPVPGLVGQTLHAKTIGFVHPRTGDYMEVEAPLPDYFKDLLKKLGKRDTMEIE